MSEQEDPYMKEPIDSQEHKIPRWLILSYILLPLWGIAAMYFYWNGSEGSWFDRGYWGQLQQAANTTYPFVDHDAADVQNP